MFTHQRPGLDLNGAWRFCPDPMQRCRRQQWWRNPPKADSPFPCWDPEGLWTIQVPGTWNQQFVNLEWYQGHAVYLREFTAPAVPADHEAYLVFDGVVYGSEVYLNGQFIGQHEWGYAPFTFCVTEVLQEFNRLFVLVENQLKADRVPGEIFDWFNDGGIINPVKLIFVPRAHIENFRVSTRLADAEVLIEVDVHLRARDTQATELVTVRIPELELATTVTARAGQPVTATLRVPRARIALWCPAHPKLYRVELATRHETIADDIGCREIRTQGRDLLLNGDVIRLYGVCVHAEFPGAGRSATAAGVAQLVAEAKALGANFLRCAHYPYSGDFARAIDRAGLLRLEEVPAYWLFNMREEGQTRRACGMMAETIRRDWNRASIIMWSVSNECCYRNPQQHDEHNHSYWFTVVPLVRQLDPSRLLTCAEAQNMVAIDPTWRPTQADDFTQGKPAAAQHWRLMHTDAWYQLFDVLAGNVYVGLGEADAAYRRFVALLRPYNKPLLISEFGTVSLRGAQVPDDALISEVRASHLVREAFAAFGELPDLSGYCLWSLTDYRTPLHWRWYCQPGAIGRFGVIDEHGQRKELLFAAVRTAIAALKVKRGDPAIHAPDPPLTQE